MATTTATAASIELGRSLSSLLGLSGTAGTAERALHQVLEALSDGVVVVSSAGDVVFTNAAARSLGVYGDRPAQRDLWADVWQQVTFFDLPEIEFEEPPLTSRVATGESFEDEIQFFRDPSTPLGRWLSASGQPLFDERGQRVGGLLVVRDVSARRAAEQALVASEEKFRQLVDSLDSVFWVVSAVGERLTYVSPAFESIWGASAREVYADPDLWVRRVHPDEQAALRTGMEQLKEVGRFDLTYRVVHPSGSTRWVRDQGRAIMDARGEIQRWVGVAADVTELVETQRALEDGIRALEKSNTELEQFARIASHDLQEPLRMISSYTDILTTEYAARLDDEGRDFLSFARDGALRMQRMIRDLLAYSRVPSQGIEMEVVDLLSVVDRVLRDHAVFLREQNATVEVRAPLPIVTGDSGLLERLLANLVSNAAKYRRGPGVHIRISGFEGSQGPRLIVEDNGLGIAPTQLERIFEPLTRLLPHDPQRKGSGMGLAIARRIAEVHGGRLEVHSEPDRGSTFALCLPS